MCATARSSDRCRWRPGTSKGNEHAITGKSAFDFAAFEDAFERKDSDRRVPFYVDAAEWVAYRHISPPRAPNRTVAKQRIAGFLARVCGVDLGITVADEVIGADRVAFGVERAFPDGKRVFEHVIARVEDGRITRQVDVEAWDE